jgi:hypothetical protein
LDLNPIEYLNSNEAPRIVFDNSLLRNWDGMSPLEQYLAEQRVGILYLDPSVLVWLRSKPQAKNMLDNPGTAGWLTLAHEERTDGSWAFLAKM